MKLVVGLGNPGSQYENTRHNVGFVAAEILRGLKGFSKEKSLFHALISEATIGGNKVLVAKPQTFMNLSGQSVREIMNYYHLSSDDLIVIYDDIDLEFGKLRIRPNGSAGGHNGMKNIIREINSSEFARVRIGVGAKPPGWDLADYVLSHFSDTEQSEIENTCHRAASAALCILENDTQTAMNQFSNK